MSKYLATIGIDYGVTKYVFCVFGLVDYIEIQNASKVINLEIEILKINWERIVIRDLYRYVEIISFVHTEHVLFTRPCVWSTQMNMLTQSLSDRYYFSGNMFL